MKPFPCTRCAECCRFLAVMLDKNREALEADPTFGPIMKEFPYKIIDGQCEKLNPDLSCSVYQDRPTICNIEKLSKTFYPGSNLYEVYRITAEQCNNLIMNSTNIPEEDKPKYFVKL